MHFESLSADRRSNAANMTCYDRWVMRRRKVDSLHTVEWGVRLPREWLMLALLNHSKRNTRSN